MKVRGNDALNRIDERITRRTQREFASVGNRSLEVQRKQAQEPDPSADVISTEDVDIEESIKEHYSDLPAEERRVALKMIDKGYAYAVQFLNPDGTEFGDPIYFKAPSEVGRFMRDNPELRMAWSNNLRESLGEATLEEIKSPYDPKYVANVIRNDLMSWVGQVDQLQDSPHDDPDIMVDTIASEYDNEEGQAKDMLSNLDMEPSEGDEDDPEYWQWEIERAERAYEKVADLLTRRSGLPGTIYFRWHDGGFRMFYTWEVEDHPELIEHDDGSPEMVGEALHAVGSNDTIEEDTVEELAQGEFEVLVDHMDKMVDKFTPDEGAEGAHRVVMERKVGERFRNMRSFLQWAAHEYGTSEKPRDWLAIDDGRVTTNQLETDDGYAVTSKDREYQAWEAGELELWLADYSFYITFIEAREPTVDEIVGVSGMRRD